jgi:hypothetical protein
MEIKKIIMLRIFNGNNLFLPNHPSNKMMVLVNHKKDGNKEINLDNPQPRFFEKNKVQRLYGYGLYILWLKI